MNRVLISIGCNNYSYCEKLKGAEADALRVFQTLTRVDVGNYDPLRSKLLLSPTLHEVQTSLSDVLFAPGKIETLAFYFAGHGSYRASSFYMCLKDSQRDKLSATALPLVELFMKMSESAPLHSDIILDACFSGGLISDLSVLLKPDLMGDAGTPSVTLLAMSARDQPSFEDANGGQATSALLDCVTGAAFVHDSTPWLDLTEIGKKVSEKIGEKVQQTPVIWGLNLNVQSAFCKNPHFQSKIDTTFRKWTPRSFFDVVSPLLRVHEAAPRDQVRDVERLISGLLERANNVDDAFTRAEVGASGIACLLEYSKTGPVDDYINHAALDVAENIEKALRQACDALKENKFALLGSGGLADLFYLPFRISKMLGWAGAAWHTKHHLGLGADFDCACFKRFIDLIIENYSTSIKSITDAQAPYVASALTALHDLKFDEQGEAIASFMFNSAIECNGNFARCDLEPDKVLAYLMQREANNFTTITNMLARPSELLTVLLKSARFFSLEETFDYEMSAFDHLTINAYIPDDYRFFSQETISGGLNACILIGNDIWTISELENAWPSKANNAPQSAGVFVGATLSSMLFNDRVPWFLFSPRS